MVSLSYQQRCKTNDSKSLFAVGLLRENFASGWESHEHGRPFGIAALYTRNTYVLQMVLFVHASAIRPPSCSTKPTEGLGDTHVFQPQSHGDGISTRVGILDQNPSLPFLTHEQQRQWMFFAYRGISMIT